MRRCHQHVSADLSRPRLSDKNWCNLPQATVLSTEDAFQMHRRTVTRTASLLSLEYSAHFLSLCK